MPNKSSDALFQLIKSLQKGEKRNFKLYIHRNAANQQLKTVLLFDALDKMERYDEDALLQKTKDISKEQLSNLKAQLYREILNSLRLIPGEGEIELMLQEQMAHARILYHKGLYQQSLQTLDKLKTMAAAQQQLTYQQQANFLEKQIESLHITRSHEDRAQRLSAEGEVLERQLSLANQYSNLALQLYSWYIRNGLARNATDASAVHTFFERHRPVEAQPGDSFYVRLYYCQSHCWHAFIQQDFLNYYRYTQKWVDLFELYPEMLAVEAIQYIKGMHNLLNASFSLRNYRKYNETLKRFESFAKTDIVQQSQNNRIQTFIYGAIAHINTHFNNGTFHDGLALIPEIETGLKLYALHLDEHRTLVCYYKFACLHFGCGNYEQTIGYLSRIINQKITLRTDLHCYARLLHLIAHYELGNFDLIRYLIKSVYRFMAKMKNLMGAEEQILLFLRKMPEISPKQLKPAFVALLSALRGMEGDRFETRAFAYLDVTSWLESKISDVSVDVIIQQKYQRSLSASLPTSDAASKRRLL